MATHACSGSGLFFFCGSDVGELAEPCDPDLHGMYDVKESSEAPHALSQ